jgi:3-phosphoshikimate 1-carboxyvinyltransferase
MPGDHFMRFTTEKSSLGGRVRIPGSKSHTVRAVFFALLAEGESRIRTPLDSGDTRSALAAAQALGATVRETDDGWVVRGTNGAPARPEAPVDVGNSGTTLYIALAVAALLREGVVTFDGDGQIRRRSAANLLRSLEDLGARDVRSRNDGCCPITIGGPLAGGVTTIACPTSQYLTSLLMAAPFAEDASVIDVPLLHEVPYVLMTLDWMVRLGLRADATPDLRRFRVPGGQRIAGFERAVPGDFSSATFFLVAAAVTGSELLLEGLDMTDPQGDKAVVDYLRAMGAEIDETDAGLLVRKGRGLRGAELDLNATPDALPAMAVAAAAAEGETRLGNVPQARMKETDRIAVMARELARLDVDVEEREDGLVIRGGRIEGGSVHGHGDHRVVMAFAVAGLVAEGPLTVDTAEAAGITVPDFPERLAAAGGRIHAEA